MLIPHLQNVCEPYVPTPIPVLEACLGTRFRVSLLRGVLYAEPSQADYVQRGCLGVSTAYIALSFQLFVSGNIWAEPPGFELPDVDDISMIIELHNLNRLSMSVVITGAEGIFPFVGASEHPPTLGCQQTGAASSSGSTGPSLAVVAAAGAGAIVLVGALAAFALHRRRQAEFTQVSVGEPEPY